jgi:hypothetical protein
MEAAPGRERRPPSVRDAAHRRATDEASAARLTKADVAHIDCVETLPIYEMVGEQ